ncbi:ABC-F family ATP-binding cassette domain-containing protein [Jatrophihabitans sp. YIM 134969]
MAATPRNLVNLERVSISFGTRAVLDEVSLGLGAGERIGVVGRNGGGKSTLLKIVTGELAPDTGRVSRTSGLRVQTVSQRGGAAAGATVRTEVVGDGAVHEWAGDAAIRDVLYGLGVTSAASTIDLDTRVDTMSGGERRRVDLARALVQPTDVLVLDEPTNHLDVEGIAWLASHLASRREALLVVTHDRWFLDAVVTRTWEVGDGEVRAHDGGYAAYVLARAERAREADAQEARRQNLMRKELAWLRRGPPARTSKPQFRINAAEALIADVPEVRRDVELVTMARRRLGRAVYDVEDVTVRAGSKLLLDHVTWRVGPGERVGIVGVNGSGKTHLLRLLIGTVAPSSGEVKVGQTVAVGYLSQDVGELPDTLRVLEAVREIADRAVIGGVEQTAAQLAERFGFDPAQHWTPVADLSGGERRRLQLLRVLLAEPNVLLLDEPTNDLDTDTLAALEDLLDAFAGTVVVVSHDRYLLERVCTSTVALLGDGSLAALPGGVEEYLRRRAASLAAAVSGPTAVTARPDAPAAAAARTESRETRKELQRLERAVARLDAEEADLHAQMAEHATDFAKIAELDARLRDVVARKEAAEEAWLELAG